MRALRIALIFVAALGCAVVVRRPSNAVGEGAAKATSESKPASAAQQGAPTTIFPDKLNFVTSENDGFIVLVGAPCPGGDPANTKFELLPPTPGFVTLQPLCGSSELVVVAPQKGDTGKHTVLVKITPCNGPFQVQNFNVKVKRAG